MHENIAIIGAGMGGLLLARVLQQRGVSAMLFERESAPDARSQGGTLDLHPGSGQHALSVAGLSEEFWALARTDADDSTIVDPTGHVVAHLKADPEADEARAPEIDRPQLRQILLDAVAADSIRWGAELVSVEHRDGGGWKLHFRDGSLVTCDLLIGADGSRSRIRPLVNDFTPVFRYAYVELGIENADQTAPQIAEQVGPGSFRALGDDLNLMAQRNGDGSIRVSVSARGDEQWFEEHQITASDPIGSKRRLRALFDGWNPSLVAMLDATDDQVIPRPISATPLEVRWDSQPDVTLLGDAAHLMAPTGDGANEAMLDGAVLGTAIAEILESGAPLRDAVLRYESEMFPRATAMAKHSRQMDELGLSSNAAETLARMLGNQDDVH
ncbi:FAD-dependent oxidoreductase [Curtobacterium flaccumfaciens]|uniref:FAD-dependent oxidoreductase n=1 Tax=Curtobacterium flaccumfaciens TaxID=2035 RepID=UPI0022B837EE|nr:NAD(P)/FAD-dependent oxidoreductase [Curtobacterium allii]MCE0459474.1 FAD-dependent monooxygenase [Curtobacterium allii]